MDRLRIVVKLLGRILANPWWILVFAALAWGPVFVAEVLSEMSPSLNASYAPQAFAISWLPEIVYFSILSIAFLVLHLVRLLVRDVRRKDASGRAAETNQGEPGVGLWFRAVLSVLWFGALVPAGFFLWLWISYERNTSAETWLITEGYVGWMRLDYSVAGAPPLPKDHGHYIVRMPKSGRLQTSTANTPRIDDNQYYSEGSSGARKLLPRDADPDYAARGVSSFGKSKPHEPFFSREAECVFVGTYAQFNSNGRNCMAWKAGEPQPPENRNHSKP